MPREVRDLGASIRARLRNLATQSGQSFDLILTRYALERLLYRLSRSVYAERFVLKGAMLLMTWLDEPHRGTRDLDLLGYGNSDADAMLAAFREILALEDADGVVFDIASLRVEQIREELEYGGLRLRTIAAISGARIVVTIDIGFGDSTDPGADLIDYPSLIGLPAPRLRAYARETVIAEKFQAMVVLGRANSRMKDFYDIWVLSRSFAFADDRLMRAIAATFSRRGTPIPVEPPDALTPAFAGDAAKQQQWAAFCEGVSLAPGGLGDVTMAIEAFLMPHAIAAANLASGQAR